MMALMPSYISGDKEAFGLKAICLFSANTAVGKDTHQGAVMLFSADTGELLAVVNASAVTAIRTAAVSGLATRLLARENAHDLAIVGAGVQAAPHLEAMAQARTIARARIVDVNHDRAREFAERVSASYPFPIEAVKSNEEALRGAEIIVTVTNSTDPVMRREWISDGAHINAVGACMPNAREVDADTMAAAKLYVDLRESALNEAGDYILAAREGAIGPDHIRGELGELLTGKAIGRTSERDITLFESLGLAVEDLAAVEYLHRKAKANQAGIWVDS
jgi:ornithine cyclodeaminase